VRAADRRGEPIISARLFPLLSSFSFLLSSLPLFACPLSLLLPLPLFPSSSLLLASSLIRPFCPFFLLLSILSFALRPARPRSAFPAFLSVAFVLLSSFSLSLFLSLFSSALLLQFVSLVSCRSVDMRDGQPTTRGSRLVSLVAIDALYKLSFSSNDHRYLDKFALDGDLEPDAAAGRARGLQLVAPAPTTREAAAAGPPLTARARLLSIEPSASICGCVCNPTRVMHVKCSVFFQCTPDHLRAIPRLR